MKAHLYIYLYLYSNTCNNGLFSKKNEQHFRRFPGFHCLTRFSLKSTKTNKINNGFLDKGPFYGVYDVNLQVSRAMLHDVTDHVITYPK